MRFQSYRVKCGEDVRDYGCAECLNGTCECLLYALAQQRRRGVVAAKVYGITEAGEERCLASVQAADVEETGPLAYVPRHQTAARAMRARRISLTKTMRPWHWHEKRVSRWSGV